MDELNKKIESRINEIKGGFEKIVKEKEGLIKRINELNVVQIDFSARYTELVSFLPKNKQKKYLNTKPIPQKEEEQKR